MASVYGYLTLANFENFMGTDYSAVDSTAYSDTRVEFIITTAEETVNAILGLSSAIGTITNTVTIATKLLAGWYITQSMNNLGYRNESKNPIFDLGFPQIYEIAKNILAGDSDVGVDTIPMGGAVSTTDTYGIDSWSL